MPVMWNQSAYSQYGEQQTLAAVIAGESSSYQGQLAVATVMNNRLTDGLYNSNSSFGDTWQSVVTPSQFNGFNLSAAQPGSQAWNLAGQMMDGSLPASDAGNALYFAAPSSANAAWANPNTSQGKAFFASATPIGGNYFSDQLGPPSSAFTGGQGVASGAPSSDQIASSSGTTGSDAGGGSPSTGFGGGGDQSTGSAFSGTPLQNMGVGQQASGATGAQGGQPITASGASQASSGGGGIPIQITNAAQVSQTAGQTVKQGAEQLGKQVQQTGQAADQTLTADTQSITTSGTGWLQYAGNLVFDLLPRMGVGVVAVGIILVGLWMMQRQNETAAIPVRVRA